MIFKVIAPSVHRTNKTWGTGLPLVFPCSLGRSPSRHEPVLSGCQVLGQPGMFGPLLFVLIDPPFTLCCAPLLVPRIPSAIEAWNPVSARVKIQDVGATSVRNALSWLTTTIPPWLPRSFSVR